jgi:hypothetical protein
MIDAMSMASAAGSHARLLLIVGALVGCSSVVDCRPVEEFHDPKVFNATDSTIELFIVSDGVEVPLGSVAAHTNGGLPSFDRICTKGTLIARSDSGQEVARRTEPLCADESWNVGP